MKTNFIYSVLVLSALFIGFNDSYAYGANQKTIKNLQDAFIGETTASAKYAAYSKKAKEEGFLRIGLLFEAASKSESIHANNHKAVLQQLGGTIPVVNPKFDVKTTKENLDDALKGESYEVSTMYPDFIKQAQSENSSLAMISLNYAYQTEKKHKAMYTDAIESLKNGAEKQMSEIYYIGNILYMFNLW